MILAECLQIVMSSSSLGFQICVVVRVLFLDIDLIEPTLWNQHGFAVCSVVIQSGLQVRFVVIMIQVVIQKRPIESHIDLPE